MQIRRTFRDTLQTLEIAGEPREHIDAQLFGRFTLCFCKGIGRAQLALNRRFVLPAKSATGARS